MISRKSTALLLQQITAPVDLQDMRRMLNGLDDRKETNCSEKERLDFEWAAFNRFCIALTKRMFCIIRA